MQQEEVDYPSVNHEMLKKDGKWAFDALNIMNLK
jgi:hypothetical protein